MGCLCLLRVDDGVTTSLDEQCIAASSQRINRYKLSGISWSAPFWVMALLEKDARIGIVTFQEAVWDNHQDVVIVQRRSIEL